MLYLLATTNQWRLHGLDLATAFPQTQPTEADQRLWTSGVSELKEALDVPEQSVLWILRNIYGSTIAPRGLWLDLHKTLTGTGAIAALGERCLWLWFSSHEKDVTGKFPRLIGAMEVMLMIFITSVMNSHRNGSLSVPRLTRHTNGAA